MRRDPRRTGNCARPSPCSAHCAADTPVGNLPLAVPRGIAMLRARRSLARAVLVGSRRAGHSAASQTVTTTAAAVAPSSQKPAAGCVAHAALRPSRPRAQTAASLGASNGAMLEAKAAADVASGPGGHLPATARSLAATFRGSWYRSRTVSLLTNGTRSCSVPKSCATCAGAG